MNQISIKELNHLLSNVDIYLLDQLLKARFKPNEKILDAGCGEGRNLIYFVGQNYNVWGVDQNEEAVQMLQHIVRSVNRDFPTDHFAVADICQLPFENEFFDAVISSAVMHFANDEQHFFQMVAEQWRVLKPGGTFFVRMTADHGIRKLAKPMGDGKYYLPDDTVRFLLTDALREKFITTFGFDFIEPYKVVVVDKMRSMNVMVLKKK